jgi:hypothetical protein
MPGFFALAAGAPDLRAAWTREAGQRLRTPCAHRLGERTKSLCHERVLSFRARARQPPDCRAHWERNQRLDGSRPELTAAGSGLHTLSADSIEPVRRQLIQPNAVTEAASGFRPLHVLAPFCEENDSRPRPGRRPSPSLDVAPRFASRLGSTTAPRCFESVSTTDFRVTCTRRNTLSGDLVSAAKNPQAFVRGCLSPATFPPFVRETRRTILR